MMIRHTATGSWAGNLSCILNRQDEIKRQLDNPPGKDGIEYDRSNIGLLLSSFYSDKSNIGKNRDIYPFHVVPGNLSLAETDALLESNAGLCAMLPILPSSPDKSKEFLAQMKYELMEDCLTIILR